MGWGPTEALGAEAGSATLQSLTQHECWLTLSSAQSAKAAVEVGVAEVIAIRPPNTNRGSTGDSTRPWIYGSIDMSSIA
jgi:hypothetical protein